MLSAERAKKIAMDWHGGLHTALYEFGSSGRTTNAVALLQEIDNEIELCLDNLKSYKKGQDAREAGANTKHLIDLYMYIGHHFM